MIRVDFDQPAYLRASKGLAVLSSRLQHLLPEADEQYPAAPAEPVIINRLYNGSSVVKAPVGQPSEDDSIKGEFIPLDSEDSDGVELNFGGIEGESVTGAYGGSGYAPYRFNKKNSKSFFLRVGKHLIWGIELAQELRRSGAEKGQEIQVTFLGKKPVTVLKEVSRNGQKETEWVTTHKNLWEVKTR